MSRDNRSNPRTRRLRWVLWGASLFAFTSIVLVVALTRPGATHIPGTDVEGITRRLSRNLPDDYPHVTFVDVTAAAGIDFVHFNGNRTEQLPEDMGSGAAWGDYDNDGLEDLFVANESGPLGSDDAAEDQSPARCHLYHNEGGGRFRERAVEAGVDCRGIGMGAAWGDYNSDGWTDLLVSFYGTSRLYANNGDGTFRDVSRASGIAAHEGFWTGVSWADYDRDGNLDVYVTGYVKYVHLSDVSAQPQYGIDQPANLNPSSFEPERNLLFHNRGDGTFEEVAERSGVSNADGRSLSASWADFDSDGWLDLYVANDISDNVLYRNLGNGFFEDLSYTARVADYRGAMGLAVGDWDGDSDLDMFVTHFLAQENALYDNLITRPTGEEVRRGRLHFSDVADRFGLGQIALSFVGWGTSFFDYDNDGQLDLFVTNGSVIQEGDSVRTLIPMTDQMFWNRGPQLGFYDMSPVAGAYFERKLVGRGAAFADYDNDGDVDIFITNNNGPGILLRNEGGNERAWLSVRLIGERSGSAGIGSLVRIVSGGKSQIRQVGAQSSYLSQNSMVSHFGLGGSTAVDTVEVTWPSGERIVRTDIPSRQTLVIEKPGTP